MLASGGSFLLGTILYFFIRVKFKIRYDLILKFLSTLVLFKYVMRM